MTRVELSLLTEAGDLLGRLPLPGLTGPDARAGGPGGGGRAAAPLRLADEMDGAVGLVRAALAGEGLAPADDDLGLRIALSRALLAAPDRGPEGADAACPGTLAIPLTVRPTAPGGAHRQGMLADTAAEAEAGSICGMSAAAWDDLFDGDFVADTADDSGGPDGRGGDIDDGLGAGGDAAAARGRNGHETL